MNHSISKGIADLLNKRNKLPKKVESIEVSNNSYFYIAVEGPNKKEKVIACARAKCMSFFAYEIKHVAVDEEFEGHGFGKYVIGLAENYIKSKNIPVAMATTRADNHPIIHLFKKLGYTPSNEFVNEGTKNPLILWQKFLQDEKIKIPSVER